MQVAEERTHDRRTVTKKEAKDKINKARETARRVGHVEKQDIVQRGVEDDKNLYVIDEDETETIEEIPDNDEELQTWCLLGETENEW